MAAPGSSKAGSVHPHRAAFRLGCRTGTGVDLQRLRKRYVASPLALDYHLAFFVYAIMIKKQRGFSQQKRLLTSIRESFSDTQAALFELACGISDLSQDLIEAEIHLHRCLKINSEPLFNALGHYYASLLYFKKGKSLLASEHCANASLHVQSGKLLSLSDLLSYPVRGDPGDAGI